MMREEILEVAALAETPEEKLCLLRERIQAAALRSLHELGAFEKLCMTGETARHFACGVPEHVADLEFRLVDKKGYKPEQWLFAVKRRLHFMGLDVRIAFARKVSTHSGWVKVMGLLAEAGLAESEAETIGFRIVIDIEPIEPAMCTVKLVDMAGECFGIRYINR